MENITDLASKYSIKVIEDAAHAFPVFKTGNVQEIWLMQVFILFMRQNNYNW